MTGPVVDPPGVPDAAAYLARLLRLDPTAVVRIRPAGTGQVALWARLPFEVLVTRVVPSGLETDVTVRADALLDVLEAGTGGLPTRMDADWRGPLPPPTSRVLERVPADAVRRVALAAGETVRAATGRGLGERVVRDAVLDHVALTVQAGEERAEVPVRMVQGLVRMGFLAEDAVRVCRAGGWLGIDATYGSVWYRSSLGLSPIRVNPH